MIKKVVLTAFALISFLVIDAQAAISEDVIKESIVKHSMEMGVDPALALSIAKKESGFKHELKSPYGAVGVFQVLPSTAKKIGYNPYKINENIKGGIAYYKMMYKMFGSIELALAAYNAGPGNVRKYKGIPPFKETKRFVNVIMQDYHNQKINPDPVITKYSKKAAIAEDKQVEISNTVNKPDLPDLKEIAEPKQNETTMEVL